jgi:hypothetical protein
MALAIDIDIGIGIGIGIVDTVATVVIPRKAVGEACSYLLARSTNLLLR